MQALTAGDLTVRIGEPTGLEVVADGGATSIGLIGVSFQTTGSVGNRRWRSGPAQWAMGPDNEDAPIDHGWWRATSVTDVAVGNDASSALVRYSTDDPDGRGLTVELVVDTDGAELSVVVPGDDVEAVRAEFAVAGDERWLGFGQRSDRTVRDSGVVEHYVSDGPWQDWEYETYGAAIPAFGVRQRRDATYFPVPWVLSTRGYGVAITSDAVSYVQLRPDDQPTWSVEVEDRTLHLRLVPGPEPLDALRRYTHGTGRQATPEPWWFGPWYGTGHENHVPLATEREQIERLRAAGAPVSAAETHCRYLPVGEHRGHAELEQARVDQLHAAGLAVLSYLNPLLSVEFGEAYEPAAAAGAVMRRADGTPYVFAAYAGGREPPETLETQYDLTTELGAEHWGRVAGLAVDVGYDGWMEDFGEYTPLDAVLGADGNDGADTAGVAGTAGHNRYPTDYHAAAARLTDALERRSGRRLARFVRSGWTGTAAVAPLMWGGDPTTGWDFDGLASAVTCGLSAGASGIAMWGSDIGGFVSSRDRLTDDLLCRWIEFGACCPLMRTKVGGLQTPGIVRPQIWDEQILPTWVRWASFHTRLNPYLRAAHATYAATGRPIMTAMALAYPDDPQLVEVEDAYLFGPDLLVAPVLTDGSRERSVRLPEDGWVDLGRALSYEPETRELTPAGGAERLGGPGDVVIPAPLDRIPILLRAGAVLPLLSADVDSLSPYPADGVVNAADREDRRTLLCFPTGTWSGFLGPDEPVTSEVTGSTWSLDVSGAPRRRYEIRADLALLGSPAELEVDGAETWTYASGVLTATVTAPRLAIRF